MKLVMLRVLALLLLVAQVWIGCARGASICVALGEPCDGGAAEAAFCCHSSHREAEHSSPEHSFPGHSFPGHSFPGQRDQACCDGHGSASASCHEPSASPDRRPAHADAHDHDHSASIALAVDHDPCCCCVHLPGGVPDLIGSLVDRHERDGGPIDSSPAVAAPPALDRDALGEMRSTTLAAPRHPPPDRGSLADSRALRATRLLV